MPILQLSPSVVSKIAAGEVVERPSSAVKEMLENSLDALAKSVTVELGDGGRDFIRVVDDGVGIPRDELLLAVTSHATSKLTSADDLFRVQTLGFRGEAVASIAGVSDFVLKSRPKDQPTGAMIEVRHGEVFPVRDCGCPPGTQVEVRNLFASVPVRRKFLKARQTELGHVTETVIRTALAYPPVALKVVHNDRVVLERPADLDRRATIAKLFGSKVADSLLPVEMERDGLRVSGFVASPEIDRNNAKHQYLFVNGRFIRDRSLGHAISEAYRGLIMTGRYPVVFLFLETPPEQVDVNVHPTKIEVRFQDPHKLYSLLLSAIRTRFLASDLTPRLQSPAKHEETPQTSGADRDQLRGADRDQQSRKNAINEEFALSSGAADETQPGLFDGVPPRTEASAQAANLGRSGAYMVSPPPVLPETPSRTEGFGPPGFTSPSPHFSRSQPQGESSRPAYPAPVSAPDPPIDGPDGSINGQQTPAPPPFTSPKPGPATANGTGERAKAMQLHDSYLVVETDDGMLLVDQHALHERILYERLRRQVADSGVEVQQLLVPEPVDLSSLQVGLLMEQKDVLSRMGLIVEEFGNQCVLLQGFPALLRKIKPEPLLREIADHFEESGKSPSQDQLLEDLLHMTACKAAVKAGDPLSDEEIQDLLRSRRLVEDSHHCPHGRPTILRYTLRELEKQFKRV